MDSCCLSIFALSRRSFLNGVLKVVLRDWNTGRLLDCDLVVSESSLENLNPFSFRLARSSSKVRIVCWGLSASDGSWFLHDVHMQQKVRIEITPHNVAITERLATLESCKHIKPNAIRKYTMLLSRKKHHIRQWFYIHHTRRRKHSPPHQQCVRQADNDR